MLPRLGRRFTILMPRARLLEKPRHCAARKTPALRGFFYFIACIFIKARGGAAAQGQIPVSPRYGRGTSAAVFPETAHGLRRHPAHVLWSIPACSCGCVRTTVRSNRGLSWRERSCDAFTVEPKGSANLGVLDHGGSLVGLSRSHLVGSKTVGAGPPPVKMDKMLQRSPSPG
jgi:hypothetical protein